MKTKLFADSLLALFVIAVVSSAFHVPSVSFGYAGTNIYVDPPVVTRYTNDTSVGSTFTVSLGFGNMTNLAGIQYTLYWKRDVLNVTSIHDNLPWTEPPFVMPNATEYNYNGTHARLNFMAVSMSGSFNGSSNFRNVTFTIISAPVGDGNSLQTAISYGEYGTETIFGNLSAIVIPAEVHNSEFVYANPAPDVAILRVEPKSPVVQQDSSVDIEVETSNNGNSPQNFTVSVYTNSSTGSIYLVGKQNVTNLQGHISQNMTFVWNTTGIPLGFYQVFANATAVPGEANITNNQMYGTIEFELIIPEYPSFLGVLLFAVATLLVVVIYKKKLR